MCLALYIASNRALPVIPYPVYPEGIFFSPTFPRVAQKFTSQPLKPDKECVRANFSFPHVLYAGSYEGCACGFNYGREYPDFEINAEALMAARESVAELVRYVRESGVREVYSCWMGDECESIDHTRSVLPDELAAPDFFFRERELLTIELTKVLQITGANG